jgi:hypothetical protein
MVPDAVAQAKRYVFLVHAEDRELEQIYASL